MKRNSALLLTFVLLAAFIAGGYFALRKNETTRHGDPARVANAIVRFGVSPFQDTLVPIVGSERGWYNDEGLDVRFSVLAWEEVIPALSGGSIDIAISNETAVIAAHQQNPELVYWYALNPFDDGFALMIRPDGRLKPLAYFLQRQSSRAEAVRLTAAQLRGATVITTSHTDMEQGVAAAARRGGLGFPRDLKIIDLNADEGLAAFLRGEGDAYIGGIPQRSRASKEGMLEMLTGADLGPPPINGIVTTRAYAREHNDELLRILHVWFRIVRSINAEPESGGGAIIVNKLNRETGTQFTMDDFNRFWNKLEHYPQSPREIEESILSPMGKNYWRARWDDTNDYLVNIRKTIDRPVSPEDAFLMPSAQRAYVERFGFEE